MAITLTPFLWYQEKAEEAAAFYADLLPDSHVDAVHSMGVDTPSGPPGSVKVVSFTLVGRPITIMGCTGPTTLNNSFSLSLGCDTQDQIDHYWDALLDGGQSLACGWLTDRYGLSWQIVPNQISDWTMGPDKAGAKRAAETMMQMIKMDMNVLEAAYKGDAA